TNPKGKFLPGKNPGEFNKPTGIAVSHDRIAVADKNNNRIQVFDLHANFLFQIKLDQVAPTSNPSEEEPEEDEEESKPFGIALDSSNHVYVTDAENDRLLAFDSQGLLLWTQPFKNPRGVAMSPLGYLYIAERGNKRISKIDPFQNSVLAFGSSMGLHHPSGVALDALSHLYITDRKNDRILKLGLPDTSLVVDLPPPPKKSKIGSSGGIVEREDKVKVEIPHGALNQELEITIEGEKSESTEEETAKQNRLKEKNLEKIREGVEYGPSGTVFEKPVTITLTYDPNALPQSLRDEDLKIHYWNPLKMDWEPLESRVDTLSRTVSAQTTHFSIYTILGSLIESAAVPSSGEMVLGEVYAYPNPVPPGKDPVFHVEANNADRIQLKIYTLSGQLAHEAAFSGASEYRWQDHIPSGIYFYVVTAEKSGSSAQKRTGKFAVVR
ncbi:MAG: T9SS type A sorting domain-containing protein, partial [Elusimicrobia bacterium]|nr:T9SS type A sorting domain-containing protein [Elusimicrobiota bacterium]